MDGLVFADKLLQLVAAADHNSTYKMATAIALMQVAQEQGLEGAPLLPTQRIAEVVIELYALQGRHSPRPLRQMNREDQASRILSAVDRAVAAGLGKDEPAYRSAVRDVEDSLLAYPLRLLQTSADQFLFDVPDPTKRSRRAFGSQFDGLLRLRPAALTLLQQAAPLVRPLIESAWVQRVARYNAVELDETALRRVMFGYERRPWPRRLRGVLEEFQDGCFYCGRPLPRATAGAEESGAPSKTHVDHFFPWARTMNDSLDNLVLADSACNLKKSDLLPATALVATWAARVRTHAEALTKAATLLRWPCNPLRTTRAARVLYQHYAQAGASMAWDRAAALVDLASAADELRALEGTLAGSEHAS